VLALRPLPALEDNYIWTLANDHGEALIVDPGEAAPVFEAIAAGLRPVAILLTHHHPDHVAGAAALLEKFAIPCFAPHDDRIPAASHRVGEGDRVHIEALDLSFDVLAIPGHTLSHIAYHGGGLLFCGDTLFSLGCGRLFEGSPAQMLASLDRLAALPPETTVCCGHEYTESNGRFARVVEPDNRDRDARLEEVRELRARGEPSLPSSIASERACNPFLRADLAAVRASLEQHAGAMIADRLQAFTLMREWKNGFRA